jgi:hypothetical protein
VVLSSWARASITVIGEGLISNKAVAIYKKTPKAHHDTKRTTKQKNKYMIEPGCARFGIASLLRESYHFVTTL